MSVSLSTNDEKQRFIPEKVYRRSELHDEFGGSRQSGISPSAKYRIIFLFSGSSGSQFGYKDEWINGIFHYTGEGQVGDMEYSRGNFAIKNHLHDEKELHLFTQQEKAIVKYVGQMVCIGTYTKSGFDKNGNNRQIIIFELVLLSDIIETDLNDSDKITIIANLENSSLSDLRKKALLHSVSSSTAVERKAQIWKASQAIKIYAKKRAHGICGGCRNLAPFVKRDNSPYLEVHHINRLSDGGPDDPRWVAAICPNCHRRSHYSKDKVDFNDSLRDIVQKKEMDFL